MDFNNAAPAIEILFAINAAGAGYRFFNKLLETEGANIDHKISKLITRVENYYDSFVSQNINVKNIDGFDGNSLNDVRLNCSKYVAECKLIGINLRYIAIFISLLLFAFIFFIPTGDSCLYHPSLLLHVCMFSILLLSLIGFYLIVPVATRSRLIKGLFLLFLLITLIYLTFYSFEMISSFIPPINEDTSWQLYCTITIIGLMPITFTFIARNLLRYNFKKFENEANIIVDNLDQKTKLINQIVSDLNGGKSGAPPI